MLNIVEITGEAAPRVLAIARSQTEAHTLPMQSLLCKALMT